MENYSQQYQEFRNTIESHLYKKILEGNVWDKTDLLDEGGFFKEGIDWWELPQVQYLEDGVIECYTLVLSEGTTFKGVLNEDLSNEYWFDIDEISTQNLCKILDTF